MLFATAMTQIMAKCTSTLDSRHKVPMNTQTYMLVARKLRFEQSQGNDVGANKMGTCDADLCGKTGAPSSL